MSITFRRLLSILRTLFLSGFFTMIPLALTIFFLTFVYNFIYRILEPLRRIQPEILVNVPGSEFVIATLLIILLGVVLRLFLVGTVVHYFERLITSIPLVRIVYSSAKMLVDFFKMSEKSAVSARRVVMIQYPRPGNYHLAFLLESAADSYQKVIPNEWKLKPDENYVKVFMPNSPNPTTGYFFILPEHEIVYTNISFEEAIKTLMSCGLITPESLKDLPVDGQAQRPQ